MKNLILPETDVHWNDVRSYIEAIPEEDYQHASEEAMEDFRDIKFGVRIHWGLYTKWHLQEESWPFLEMSNEDKQKYQEIYKNFDPTGFDADEWMSLFKRAGCKCFAFTSKHHEGFSMFDTKTTVKKRVNWMAGSQSPQIEDCDFSYSIMDTPFKRDIVKELCDAARKQNIKIDLYFSHPDWYDADFRPYTYHPLTVPDASKLLTENEMTGFPNRFGKMYPAHPVMVDNLTKEERQRMIKRHRQQLVELLTNYDKIDMICLDMWLGSDVWPELRETVKLLRSIQPDTMLRCRGIGNYGDYYTPERFVPENKENTDMPWMVIYPLASSFSYDPDGNNYKGGEWIINNLVDSVAKGGNFMVGIGPDENGRWHPKAIEQLEEAGRWLDINGKAIYGTRPRPDIQYKEGEDIYFTCDKNSEDIYAICTNTRNGNVINIKSLKFTEGMKVKLLGYDGNLQWNFDNISGLTIQIPNSIENQIPVFSVIRPKD